jgi:hypothetical protein
MKKSCLSCAWDFSCTTKDTVDAAECPSWKWRKHGTWPTKRKYAQTRKALTDDESQQIETQCRAVLKCIGFSGAEEVREYVTQHRMVK